MKSFGEYRLTLPYSEDSSILSRKSSRTTPMLKMRRPGHMANLHGNAPLRTPGVYGSKRAQAVHNCAHTKTHSARARLCGCLLSCLHAPPVEGSLASYSLQLHMSVRKPFVDRPWLALVDWWVWLARTNLTGVLCLRPRGTIPFFNYHPN